MKIYLCDSFLFGIVVEVAKDCFDSSHDLCTANTKGRIKIPQEEVVSPKRRPILASPLKFLAGSDAVIRFGSIRFRKKKEG